ICSRNKVTRRSRYIYVLIILVISFTIPSLSSWIAHGHNFSSLVAAYGGNNNKFEVLQIYPTAINGETWSFNSSNPMDGQFDPNKANITKNIDDSWHVQPGITRMLAFTKSSGDLSDAIRSN